MRLSFAFLFSFGFLSGFAQDGSLDASFQSQGKHHFTFHSGYNSVYDAEQQHANAFLILSDQYITRIDSSGNIDSSFATNGVLNVAPLFPNDMVVGNGRIYIGGWDSNDDPEIQCFFPDGTPDSSFGSNSISNPSLPQAQIIYDMKIDAQGRLLVGGRTNASGNHDMMIFRMNSDGSIDNSFGLNGLVTYDANGSNDEIWSIGFQSDGKILCAGENAMNFNTAAVLRLNTDGSIDNSFGTNGVFRHSVIGRNTYLDDILVLPDDRIRITGPYDNVTAYKVHVLGLTANGQFDFQWAGNGRYTHPLVDRGNALALQSDGKVLVVASDQQNFLNRTDFVVMRLDSSGTLDNSFDGDGVAAYDMLGNNDNLRAVFELPGGKLLGIGSMRDDNSNNFIGLIRLNNSVSAPCTPEFSSDTASICTGDSIQIHGSWESIAGSYPFTYTNSSGCDSIHSIQLNVLPSQFVVDSQVACGQFTWIDGSTYSQSTNTPAVVLTNQAGCDSVVQLDLTIFQEYTEVDVQNSCGAITWIDGVTYTQSTLGPSVSLTSQDGCDSLVTLDLNVVNVDTSVSRMGGSLLAGFGADSYQWIDCVSGFPMPGATSNVYTPSSNGSFAVVISEDGCTDTSRCISLQDVHVQTVQMREVQVYPNPSSGTIFLKLPPNRQHFRVEVILMDGRRLLEYSGGEQEVNRLMLPHFDGPMILRFWADGVYLGQERIMPLQERL